MQLFPEFDRALSDIGLGLGMDPDKSPVDNFVGHWQNVGEETTDAVLGEGATKDLEKKGLLKGAQDIQGDIMSGSIGNIAGSFGVEPKILLLVGAGVVALIILMKLGG